MIDILTEYTAITLDPTDHYKHADRSALLEVIGVIPYWLDIHHDYPADQAIHLNYAHGGGWHRLNGFVIDPSTGVLSYPEDPDLHPLIKYKRLEHPNEVVYQYEYG